MFVSYHENKTFEWPITPEGQTLYIRVHMVYLVSESLETRIDLYRLPVQGAAWTTQYKEDVLVHGSPTGLPETGDLYKNLRYSQIWNSGLFMVRETRV